MPLIQDEKRLDDSPPPGYGQWVTGYLSRLAAHGPQFIAANSVSDPRLLGVAA